MKFVCDDGGCAAAGYRGGAGDCVTRAIAIATGKPYQEVYDALNALGATERTGKRKRGKSSARGGVYKDTTRKYLEAGSLRRRCRSGRAARFTCAPTSCHLAGSSSPSVSTSRPSSTA